MSLNIKKRKFLFLVPPYFDRNDFDQNSGSFLPQFTIPYGVLSLIGYLEKEV